MKQSRIALVIIAILLVGGAFKAGVQFGENNQASLLQAANVTGQMAEGGDPVDFQAFWKAWNILNTKYVPNGSTSTAKSISDQDKLWGAIAGLTKSYGDPYTVFFNPEQAEAFATEVSGKFEGVGMEVGNRDNSLVVVTPLKGTPAEKAGIKAGDKIIKINDTDTTDMPVDQAVRLIRGKGGTTVRLTVFRDKEGVLPEITLTRATIDIPTGEEKVIVTPAKGTSASKSKEATTKEEKANGVYTIRLFNFGGTSVDVFKDKIQNFYNTGSNKLIIDLRGNPGGYLEAAIDIASMFLPKDSVIVKENFGSNGPEIIHKSRGYGVFKKNPNIVVLIDRGSASASEILAGALKQNGLATLVGETTFGKGSVQELVPVTPDTSLKVTVARWYTPNGESLSNGGLKPDFEVIPTKEDIAAGRDVQFDKAVELLTK